MAARQRAARALTAHSFKTHQHGHRSQINCVRTVTHLLMHKFIHLLISIDIEWCEPYCVVTATVAGINWIHGPQRYTPTIHTEQYSYTVYGAPQPGLQPAAMQPAPVVCMFRGRVSEGESITRPSSR